MSVHFNGGVGVERPNVLRQSSLAASLAGGRRETLCWSTNFPRGELGVVFVRPTSNRAVDQCQ